MPEKKLRQIRLQSICIDTLNGIQEIDYMYQSGKTNYDKWTDFGRGSFQFVKWLAQRGFTLCYIIGNEGSGKTMGMHTMEPGTNMWFNVDFKDPSWTEGIKLYGTKENPVGAFHFNGSSKEKGLTYQDIQQVIKNIQTGNVTTEYFGEPISVVFDKYPIAFCMGHMESDKRPNDEVFMRMKTMGKVSTRCGIQGATNWILYTKIERGAKGNEYYLTTESNQDTARTPYGIFGEGKIPNDLGFLRDKIRTHKSQIDSINPKDMLDKMKIY